MPILVQSLLAAALPSFLYAWFIYWVDRHEKEPIWLLTAAFFWGAIPSVLLTYLLRRFAFGNSSTVQTLFTDIGYPLLLAPIVEESLKAGALVLIFIFLRDEIDSPLDGIVYGTMIGLGFALVENTLYFNNAYLENGQSAWGLNVLFREFIFGFNHALYTSIVGLGVAFGRHSRYKFVHWLAPLAGLMLAIFLHFLHNITASVGGVYFFFMVINTWGSMFIAAVIIVFSLVQERKWLRKYLAEEYASGLLTSKEYYIACSASRRQSAYLEAFINTGYQGWKSTIRFYHKCSKLAFTKHHYAQLCDQVSENCIIELREKLQSRREKIIALSQIEPEPLVNSG